MDNFHSLDKSQVFKLLNTSSRGLTSKEGEERLNKNGFNELPPKKKESNIKKFFSQFKDIMVIILIISATISLVFSLTRKTSNELVDAVIIFVIVLINASLGFFQELHAENSLEKLKKLTQPYSKVLRNGKIIEIKTREIVCGDIVFLEAGDIVPCDLYLLESHNLKCDESALTGESENATKTSTPSPQNCSLGDRKNICFSSTVVTFGRGVGVAIKTGEDTEIGKIANLLKEKKEDLTPLQKSLNRLGEIITFIVLFIAIVIFLVDIIFAHQNYIESFLTAVAIAVAAIPESLPAVVTIILSIGVVRLSKKNAVVKKLHAVETLGCCQVICSDKTGTITKNEMTVVKTFCDLVEKKPNEKLLSCMLFCNDALIIDNKIVGEPTEKALFAFARNFTSRTSKRIGELPFDSTRKLMSTLNEEEKTTIQYTKGGVDEVLKRCNYVLINNEILPINDKIKSIILSKNKEMARRALRVLAFSYKIAQSNNLDENDLVFIGLVGMIDPPREEVFSAIKTCKKANIEVKMITGDHFLTAFSIAKQIGLVKNEEEVINGKDLDALDEKELERVVLSHAVFSRVTPEHKVKIVKALQKSGKIVAMTGDGVNDAPSLKQSDIGVGMGKNGTEVTKEVASVILTDDNFSTIVSAVEEGRTIFKNIQKTIQFLLSCNIAEVLSIFLLTLLYPSLAFLSAVQILFINLVTDTFPSIALGVDPKEKSIMSSSPRDPKKNILSGKTGFNIIYEGVVQTILIIVVYIIGLNFFKSVQIANTMAFLSINFIQLFHMYNVHSDKSIFVENPFKNKLMNIAFLLEGLLLILFATLPLFISLLGLTTLSIFQWIIVLFFSFLIIPFTELVKHLEK